MRQKYEYMLKNPEVNVRNIIHTSHISQKRKKIRTALKEIVSENELIELNLDPNIRPSNLTPNDYLKLAKRK